MSKAVGGAVKRNLVKRRLRAIAAGHLTGAADIDIVLRALPTAATATFAQVEQDVVSAWEGAQRKLAAR